MKVWKDGSYPLEKIQQRQLIGHNALAHEHLLLSIAMKCPVLILVLENLHYKDIRKKKKNHELKFFSAFSETKQI